MSALTRNFLFLLGSVDILDPYLRTNQETTPLELVNSLPPPRAENSAHHGGHADGRGADTPARGCSRFGQAASSADAQMSGDTREADGCAEMLVRD